MINKRCGTGCTGECLCCFNYSEGYQPDSIPDNDECLQPPKGGTGVSNIKDNRIKLLKKYYEKENIC